MNITDISLLKHLNTHYNGSDAADVLKWTIDTFGDKAALSTGFGASGIVLMHQLSLVNPGAEVFYLDTDLLFDETIELIDRLEQRIAVQFKRVSAELSLDEQEQRYGPSLWESRPDLCCHIRKVMPLKRHLMHKTAWITAIRRDQAASRKQTPMFQYDAALDVLKVCPLAGWTEQEIWSYIQLNELPYNTLHDQNYPSIGCRPCTRPVKDGDSLRAGRWSGSNKTECGIHTIT